MIIKEYAQSIIIAFILAMIIRTFVIQVFKIPTGSMKPTLIEGDRIIVNKFIYRFARPKTGDVIVFKYPVEPKKDFIKRLVGIPGDTLQIIDGKIIVNDRPLSGAVFKDIFYYNRGEYADVDKITVPKDSYFVLGDNSANSVDSRYWGFVPKNYLLGKAMVVFWPVNRLKVIK